MRVLYIEDDLVDQLVCKKKGTTLGVELLIVDSIKEGLNTLSQNPNFDLVISDFNLNDGTATDILEFEHPLYITVLSDSHSLQANGHHLAYDTKPLTKATFIRKPEQIYLNPAYINEVAYDDLEFKISLFSISKESIDTCMTELKTALAEKDEAKIVFQLHKIKSSIRAVGASFLPEIELLETYFKSNEITAEAELMIQKIIACLKKTKQLIETQLAALN